MKTGISLLAVTLFFTMTSCVKDKVTKEIIHYTDSEYKAISAHLNLPEKPENYSNISIVDPIFGNDGVTIQDDRATLGRVLFYDNRLSANNTISCANCHKQEKAFSDDVAFSKGFEGGLTSRNSLALGAVQSFPDSYGGGGGDVVSFGKSRFFWDERAGSIVEQSTQTLQNPVEMGADLRVLGDELLQEDFYKVLFNKAFQEHDEFPMDQKILICLESFINAISSNNSKFDAGFQQQGFNPGSFPNFTSQENQGLQLYNTNCAACHGETMRQVNELTASNGLAEVYTDKGLGGITGNSLDNGIFKVPMLRNVALTGPYMHDGRFASLEQVIDHYSSGIKDHDNLHALLRDFSGNPRKMNFSQEEKDALLAFLHTLTDISTIVQTKFSDPFKP